MTKPIDVTIAHVRGQLIQRVRVLVENSTLLLKQLEADPEFRPNDLGEIQGWAASIDATCGRLSGMMQAREMLRDEKGKSE